MSDFSDFDWNAAYLRLRAEFVQLEHELVERMDYELWMAQRIVTLEQRLARSRN